MTGDGPAAGVYERGMGGTKRQRRNRKKEKSTCCARVCRCGGRKRAEEGGEASWGDGCTAQEGCLHGLNVDVG